MNKIIISVVIIIIVMIIILISMILIDNKDSKSTYLNLKNSTLDKKEISNIRFFVINLDKDRRRYIQFVDAINKSDLKDQRINRFPAVEGNKIKNIDSWLTNDCLNELSVIETNGYRTHHHSITRGGIGCFLSFYYLAVQLLQEDSSIDYYIIFEDDTRPHTNLLSSMMNLQKEAPEDWDILLFYTNSKSGTQATNTFVKIKSFWGMNVVMIYKKGAAKLIHEVDKYKIDGQIDSYISRMSQQNKLNIYATKNNLAKANSRESNIQLPIKPIHGVNPFDYKSFDMY